MTFSGLLPDRAFYYPATLALFVGGKEVARSVGEGGETMMRKMIERYADTRGCSYGRRVRSKH